MFTQTYTYRCQSSRILFNFKKIQFTSNLKNQPIYMLIMPHVQKKIQKIPWSAVGKRWPQQGVVQFREPTCQHFSYASNPGQIQKSLMEAQKSLSSRARKRWTHQGSVQFQEPTHIHLNYASYPEESSKNLMKAGNFPYF